MRVALGAALVALLPAAASAAGEGAFAGLPGLSFVYRPIAGASIAELKESLEASAAHPREGASSYADTRWSIHWHWRGAGPGAACRVRAVEVDFGAVVTLPRLIDPAALDAATQARWDAFAAAIARHEAGHARRASDHVPVVRRAILASRCDDADRAGQAALRLLATAQRDYDRTTRNGATQGAHFP